VPDANASPTTTTETSWLGFVLRALKYRNYRLVFAGQIVSLIGNWMTSVATAWLVYRLTHSSTLLGVVGFAGQIPAFLLAPITGVLVDRWDLRRCIVVTQVLSMIQSLALAWFTFRRTIDVPHLVVLAIMQGLINAFDIPARQSFIVQIVDRREDLPNAIALNSTIVNAARLLGPGAAGVLIAAVGEAWCFLLDGVSYIAVIIALLMIRLPRRERPQRNRHVLTELREGVAAALGFAPIRAILLLLALISLAGLPYITLMPVFATDILHGGPQALGLLSGGVGAGAMIGAAFLASRRSVLGLGKVIPAAAAMLGVGLILFSFSRSFYISLAVMPLTGCSAMLAMASSNTLLQTLAEDEMRGRIMAFFTMAFMGMAPIGSLISGSLAQGIGAPMTVRLGGLICIVGALAFAFVRPSLRSLVIPIYIRRGILPAVAEGITETDNAAQAAQA